MTRIALRRSARSVPLQLIPEPADESPSELIIDSDELQQILNELPEEFRTPLILFYFDEFTYREIAEQMNVPIGTVMSRLARGKGSFANTARGDAVLAGAMIGSNWLVDFGIDRWIVEPHLRLSIAIWTA